MGFGMSSMSGTAKIANSSEQQASQRTEQSVNGIVWFSKHLPQLQLLSRLGEAANDTIRVYDQMQRQLTLKEDKIQQLEATWVQVHTVFLPFP